MFKPRILLAALALLLPACATVTLWMDPIKQTGPNTYQITHSMGPYSPVKGVRAGVTGRAKDKCTGLNLYYAKVREEITTPGNTMDYTLIFTCTSEVQPLDTKSKN